MAAKSTVDPTVWLITRKNPVTGYYERISYVGNLRDKPKGWKIIKSIGYQGE